MLQSIRFYMVLRVVRLYEPPGSEDGSCHEDSGCVARHRSLPLDEKPKRVFRTLSLV
jgi:hypothetical protein